MAKEIWLKTYPKTKLGFSKTKFSKFCQKHFEYLYEHINMVERFDKTNLHGKKYFYSSLKFEHVVGEDFEHAMKNQNKFGAKNIGYLQGFDLQISICISLLNKI